ncbi:GNAT family N-acetyltransferase [Frigidibacter sp. MR17.14]|uniref:GNAT family N-acetyltransferase n=1 Tax=Frigidibacter sp. MR17.14 TaxID=3126509 RepID=UPI003012C66F
MPFTFHDAPDDAVRQAVLQPLLASNRARGPQLDLRPFAFTIDDDAGRVLGGLVGRTAYDWAVIELLYVPPEARGRGTGRRLVAAAEALARDRGCTGIWLDSFGFQAPEFYRRLGYRVFGTLPDNPRGDSRWFLSKRLD